MGCRAIAIEIRSVVSRSAKNANTQRGQPLPLVAADHVECVETRILRNAPAIGARRTESKSPFSCQSRLTSNPRTNPWGVSPPRRMAKRRSAAIRPRSMRLTATQAVSASTIAPSTTTVRVGTILRRKCLGACGEQHHSGDRNMVRRTRHCADGWVRSNPTEVVIIRCGGASNNATFSQPANAHGCIRQALIRNLALCRSRCVR